MGQSRLLDIAVREFGLKGPEGASTRGIATAAGTAMSSITYHYGGKEGLYLAAADYIAEQMAAGMASALLAERGVAAADRDGARAAVQRIMARLIEKMAGEASEAWAMFIVREQMNPTAAFDRIYAGVMGQMLERIADLVCVATGVRDRRAASIVTVTLVGQVMALRSVRGSVMRLLDLTTLDQPTVQALQQRIHTNTGAILDAMIAEQQDRA